MALPSFFKHGRHSKDSDIVIDTSADTDEAGTAPIEAYKSALTFPASMISDSEVNYLYQMNISPEEVQKLIRKRLLAMTFFFIAMVVIAAVSNVVSLYVVALLTPAVVWVFGLLGTKQQYNNYLFQRQLSFTKFTRLLIPYLSELKKGVQLYNIFQRIVPRLDDKRDQHLLQQLMIDMGNQPDSDVPFVEFAHKFSRTDEAELFMITVFQMKQGAYNDDTIKSLGQQASKELMAQVGEVVNRKLKRFDMLTDYLTVFAFIPLLGFLASFLFSIFKQVFGGL